MILFFLVAAAAQSTPIPAAATVATTPASARMVCKSEPRANSRLTTRTCHTKAEWDEIANVNRETAHEMIDKATPNLKSSN